MSIEKTAEKTAEKVVKANIHSASAKLHDGINGADEKLDSTVDAISARLSSLESWLRDNGEQMLSSAKSVRDSARKHATDHPLAAFGVAFVAGLTVARLLRR